MTSLHSARYRQFRKRLKDARQTAGLTQVDAARALRRQQSFVSKCESGERRVDVIELEAFAKLYQKPLSFFLS
jgi:transcriptional regulator with XRE-family HTH domain